MSDNKRSITELLLDDHLIEQAARSAVREALLRHKRLGQSIAVWDQGKVVIVPPEDIKIEPAEDS